MDPSVITAGPFIAGVPEMLSRLRIREIEFCLFDEFSRGLVSVDLFSKLIELANLIRVSGQVASTAHRRFKVAQPNVRDQTRARATVSPDIAEVQADFVGGENLRNPLKRNRSLGERQE